MSRKRPRNDILHEEPRRSKPMVYDRRDGLRAYTKDPTAFGPERVIYHNDRFVVINDLFPKSTVHTLILPRDTTKHVLHPFDAFEDPVFVAEVQEEVKRVRHLVAKELRRKHGKYSATDQARFAAMDQNEPPELLPEGRDWDKEIITGIHAVPSMNHLHVHVMSRDMSGEYMKRYNHYNSFTTPFLVDVNDFPLARDDVRRHPGREGYLKSDMHLEKEFLAWRGE
ncbi:aprataxin-like protein [Elasticomyces elasticus]|nr:aprataxin-like protein [Elasticomyces elasticus]